MIQALSLLFQLYISFVRLLTSGPGPVKPTNIVVMALEFCVGMSAGMSPLPCDG